MAAERTFLAWVRTALALMGFGFIAARFGLFLREAGGGAAGAGTGAGVSLPLGITLIALGVIVNVTAAIRHRRYLRALDRGDFHRAFGSTFAFFIAAVLAAIGLWLTVYLARI